VENTISFWLVVVLMAAWPLVLVALFALSRRFPSGVPDPRRWILWAGVAAFYLAGSLYFLNSGAGGRGLGFVALGIATAAYALDQRRRSIARGARQVHGAS
jgi:hypothetical protein